MVFLEHLENKQYTNDNNYDDEWILKDQYFNNNHLGTNQKQVEEFTPWLLIDYYPISLKTTQTIEYNIIEMSEPDILKIDYMSYSISAEISSDNLFDPISWGCMLLAIRKNGNNLSLTTDSHSHLIPAGSNYKFVTKMVFIDNNTFNVSLDDNIEGAGLVYFDGYPEKTKSLNLKLNMHNP